MAQGAHSWAIHPCHQAQSQRTLESLMLRVRSTTTALRVYLQNPTNARVSANAATSLQFKKCVADDAVSGERVCAENSLLTGKLTENFVKSGHFWSG